MKHTNIRIARLKEMIALEEKRALLQGQIATVDERLSIIQDQLYGAGSSRSDAKTAAPKVVTKATKAKRKGRGELKGQILEMLQAAGESGASVKELASRIGVKTANVHSWFSINLKKIAGLKKIGAARYALTGAAPAKAVKKSKVAKKVKAKVKPKTKIKPKAKAPKTAKAVKKSKVVKPAKARTGRGQMKEQILAELKSAGAEGTTIKDLAAKLKANYKNLYVWFVTTGKSIPGLTKVGPAKYKLEAA